MTRDNSRREGPFADFGAGSQLAAPGSAPQALYIIQTGRVQLRARERVLVELGPGDLCGESLLAAGSAAGFELVAVTAVRALQIDADALQGVVRDSPEVAMQLLRQLAARLEGAWSLVDSQAAAASVAPPADAVLPGARSQPAAAVPAPPARSSTATPTPTPTPAAAPTPGASPKPAAQATARSSPAAPAPAPTPAQPPAPAVAPAPAPLPASAAMPTPIPASAPPLLRIRHAQGEILLASSRREWLVGRPDPATGQVPEVDLGTLDVARSLSRRHARLRLEDGRVVLREEPGVANGTWVNGTRLATGAAVAIEPGDTLRFGAVEVNVAAP